MLILSYNQLTALPESIVALTNLAWLFIHNNPRLIRTAQCAAVQAWVQMLKDTIRLCGLFFLNCTPRYPSR